MIPAVEIEGFAHESIAAKMEAKVEGSDDTRPDCLNCFRVLDWPMTCRQSDKERTGLERGPALIHYQLNHSRL